MAFRGPVTEGCYIGFYKVESLSFEDSLKMNMK